ncbi:hypothetical protein DEFR109230_10990 [Deinococcus frigens]
MTSNEPDSSVLDGLPKLFSPSTSFGNFAFEKPEARRKLALPFLPFQAVEVGCCGILTVLGHTLTRL